MLCRAINDGSVVELKSFDCGKKIYLYNEVGSVVELCHRNFSHVSKNITEELTMLVVS